jgi:hypothetical protein
MKRIISAEKHVANAVALAAKQTARGKPPLANQVLVKIDMGLAKRIDRLEARLAKLTK